MTQTEIWIAGQMMAENECLTFKENILTCHVDEKKLKEVYSSCVIEYGKYEDCTYAKGRTKPEQCQYWKPRTIPRVRDFNHELHAIASHLYPSVMGESAQDAAYHIAHLETKIQDLERELKSILESRK